MSNLNHKNYKLEKVNSEFADWVMMLQAKRIVLKLDKRPIGFHKFTGEMMKKQSMKELEREMLGEPHIRDVWNIDNKQVRKRV